MTIQRDWDFLLLLLWKRSFFVRCGCEGPTVLAINALLIKLPHQRDRHCRVAGLKDTYSSGLFCKDCQAWSICLINAANTPGKYLSLLPLSGTKAASRSSCLKKYKWFGENLIL